MVLLVRVTVFCGSRTGNFSEYFDVAIELGKCLSERNIDLVYGGGATGLMGSLADSVLEHGGTAIGVIPDSLKEKEMAHRHLSKLHVVDSMHDRKLMMAKLSQAFIILPGGLGTMEEFFEVATWTQLEILQKPYGFLNIIGYFQKLFSWLQEMEHQGFLDKNYASALIIDDQPNVLLDKLYEQFRKYDEMAESQG